VLQPLVGTPLGSLLGSSDGSEVGSIEGSAEGSPDGCPEGRDDGVWEGWLGLLEGCPLGIPEGKLLDGSKENPIKNKCNKHKLNATKYVIRVLLCIFGNKIQQVV